MQSLEAECSSSSSAVAREHADSTPQPAMLSDGSHAYDRPSREAAMPRHIITAVIHDGAVHTNCDPPLPWWSFTKTVLAAKALRLVAQDRLSLDEPVKGRPFTLRQLLQHRARLPDYGSLPAYHRAVEARELPWPPEELMERVRADTLVFEPGGGWGYSNVGYLLIRRLVEEATGEALNQALTRLTFDPLGIEAVKVAVTPGELNDTAWGNVRSYHPGWVFTDC